MIDSNPAGQSENSDEQFSSKHIWFSSWSYEPPLGENYVLKSKNYEEMTSEDKKLIYEKRSHFLKQVKFGLPVDSKGVFWDCIINTQYTPDRGPMKPSGMGLMISESAKAVLEQFDLGYTLFHPLTLYDLERTRRVSKEEHYVLNICNQVDTSDHDANFDPKLGNRQALRDVSEKLRRPYYFFRYTAPDYFVAKPSVLDGPDIWIDPKIDESIFLSDRLACALQDAELDAGWALTRAVTDVADRKSY